MAKLLKQPLDLGLDWVSGRPIAFVVTIEGQEQSIRVIALGDDRIPGALIPVPMLAGADIWIPVRVTDPETTEVLGWLTDDEARAYPELATGAHRRVPVGALHPLDSLLEQAGLKPTQAAMFELGDMPNSGRKWYE